MVGKLKKKQVSNVISVFFFYYFFNKSSTVCGSNFKEMNLIECGNKYKQSLDVIA